MHNVALLKTFNGLLSVFLAYVSKLMKIASERDLLVDKWFVPHNGKDTSSGKNSERFENRCKV